MGHAPARLIGVTIVQPAVFALRRGLQFGFQDAEKLTVHSHSKILVIPEIEISTRFTIHTGFNEFLHRDTTDIAVSNKA